MATSGAAEFPPYYNSVQNGADSYVFMLFSEALLLVLRYLGINPMSIVWHDTVRLFPSTAAFEGSSSRNDNLHDGDS